jgi:hypothetical protein
MVGLLAADRIISRFYVEGTQAGRRVSVVRIDPGTGERLGLLATATVGEGGWGDKGRGPRGKTWKIRSTLEVYRVAPCQRRSPIASATSSPL